MFVRISLVGSRWLDWRRCEWPWLDGITVLFPARAFSRATTSILGALDELLRPGLLCAGKSRSTRSAVIDAVCVSPVLIGLFQDGLHVENHVRVLARQRNGNLRQSLAQDARIQIEFIAFAAGSI